MKARFLRPAQGAGEYIADAVRVVGLLSIVAAFVWFTPTDAGIVALTSPALLLPRFLGVVPWLDIAYGLTVLVAAWSNVFDLYTTIAGWDIVVHTVCTAALATMLFVLLDRLRILPPVPRLRRVPIVVVTALGLAISALWEMVEWFGYTFVTDAIFVAYADTIGDMAAGGIGAVAAGAALAYVGVDEDTAAT